MGELVGKGAGDNRGGGAGGEAGGEAVWLLGAAATGLAWDGAGNCAGEGVGERDWLAKDCVAFGDRDCFVGAVGEAVGAAMEERVGEGGWAAV